ncbi:MAG: DUF2325 domain-containing protein, partial [Dehalococcoidia bacterium]|nr:DUF2325 domain-containing protein [Dehalococcoidia bacterium]
GGAALRELCAECLGSIRPLHAPALVTQLESLLGEGAPVEDVLSLVERSLRSGAWGDDATAMEVALTGLQFAFPVLRKRTLELLERNDIAPTEEPEPVFEGARVVVVGGHPGMRKHVEPTLRGWQVDVDWLDADAARTGAQAKALASGSADFVVVNTSYIGHAASGRVREAAEGAGTVVVENDATGVGTTLHRIWTSLRDLGERPAATKQRKTDRLKRHVRR